MTIDVWKQKNYEELKILFPSIDISTDYPSYKPLVFTLLDYDTRNIDFCLRNKKSGINLESTSGLATFFRKCSYMQESKIKRIELLSKRKLSVVELYKESISLKIANKSILYFDDELTIQNLVMGNLFENISSCEKLGYEESLLRIITVLDSYYQKDSGLTPAQYKYYSELFSKFDYRNFRKNFELTGNDELDCYHLLCYFN